MIKVVTDYGLTATPTGSLGPMVGDRHVPAIVLGQGPVVAAQYRDEKAGYDAYVIRPYMEPQLVIDDAIDKICTLPSSLLLYGLYYIVTNLLLCDMNEN